MNYYEHHIRDYDAATSHLSWEEDLAYTRLIRWYYRREKPVPVDVKEACRQVRAVTKAQRDAVESVLREFFTLQDDGWHNATCDEVIAAYLDGEPEREVKKANEENRLKKHRQERSALFKVLTDAGEHAPWNIKIDELREMVKRVQGSEPETPPETKNKTPATAPETPATATHTPVPNTQPPDTRDKNKDTVSESEPPLLESGDDLAPDLQPTPAGLICKAIRAEGVSTANPSHPTLLALIDAGAGEAEFRLAAREAVKAGKGNFAYVIGTVRGRREEAAKLVLHKGQMPNKQEGIEASNRAATAEWQPPELRGAA